MSVEQPRALLSMRISDDARISTCGHTFEFLLKSSTRRCCSVLVMAPTSLSASRTLELTREDLQELEPGTAASPMFRPGSVDVASHCNAIRTSCSVAPRPPGRNSTSVSPSVFGRRQIRVRVKATNTESATGRDGRSQAVGHPKPPAEDDERPPYGTRPVAEARKRAEGRPNSGTGSAGRIYTLAKASLCTQRCGARLHACRAANGSHVRRAPVRSRVGKLQGR